MVLSNCSLLQKIAVHKQTVPPERTTLAQLWYFLLTHAFIQVRVCQSRYHFQNPGTGFANPGTMMSINITIIRTNLSRSQGNSCSHAYNPCNHSRRLRVMDDCVVELYITQSANAQKLILRIVVHSNHSKILISLSALFRT